MRFAFCCLSQVSLLYSSKIQLGLTISVRNFLLLIITAIDDDVVWKNGISVIDSPNHLNKAFDSNRISLMNLMITLLSQPLFYTPEEYLVILNPFATYFTCRRSKNVKNLFISLINVVISYDTTGYVSEHC